MTLRERMEAMGWLLDVDADTLQTAWLKLRTDAKARSIVVASFPGDRAVWEADLRACGAGEEAFGHG